MIFIGFSSRMRKPGTHVQLIQALLGILLLCGLYLACGCTGQPPAADPDEQGWFGTADALARAVAQAVSKKDTQALKRLGITREEYMTMVWPHLDVSRLPGWKDNADFVWLQHAAKSNSGLAAVLGAYGATAVPLQSVNLPACPVEYGPVKIYVKPAVLTDNATTIGPAPRLMGSIIEKAGRYKIFSYNIDH